MSQVKLCHPNVVVVDTVFNLKFYCVIEMYVHAEMSHTYIELKGPEIKGYKGRRQHQTLS